MNANDFANTFRKMKTRFARLFEFRRNTEPFASSFLGVFAELKAITEWRASARDVPRILVFGDSVMERVAWQDIDKRSLGAMIADNLSESGRCEIFSYSAYHPEVFLSFIRAICRHVLRPECVIVPLNLRSVSPQWDLHPAFQFSEKIEILRRYAAGELEHAPEISYPLSGKHLEPSREQWAQYLSQEFLLSDGRTKSISYFQALIECSDTSTQMEMIRRKEIFNLHYMTELSPQNRKIVALRKIVQTCSIEGMKCLIYFTPINVQAGVEYVGPEFLQRMHQKAEFVRKLLIDGDYATGVSIIDLSCAVDCSGFFEKDTATEHLNEHGRNAIAKKVSEAAAQML